MVTTHHFVSGPWWWLFCSHPEFAQLLNLTIFLLYSAGNGTWAIFSLPLCFCLYYPLLRPLMKRSAETVLFMPRNWSPSIFLMVLSCSSFDMQFNVTVSHWTLTQACFGCQDHMTGLHAKVMWPQCSSLVTVSNISFRDAHSQTERKNCIFLSLAVWSALWFQIASSYILLFYLGHRKQLVNQLKTCILTVSRPIYLHIYQYFYIYSVFHHEWNLSLCTLCAFSSNMFLKS